MSIENGIPDKFKKWVASEKPSFAIVAKIDADEKNEIMSQINRLVYKAFKGGWIARQNELISDSIEDDEDCSNYSIVE